MPVRPPQPRGEFRAGRPADDADDCEIAVSVAKRRRAGIAGAGAEAGALPFGVRIEQADLQSAGHSRDDERCGANSPSGAAVAAHGNAIAGDHESIADGDARAVADERHRRNARRQWFGKLDQRHVRGGKMGEKPLEIELRIALDARDIFQDRLAPRVAVDQLVVGAGLHAMRRGQQQVARDRGRGAGCAVGAEDHDDGASRALGRRRRAADHRRGWNTARQQTDATAKPTVPDSARAANRISRPDPRRFIAFSIECFTAEISRFFAILRHLP